MASVISVQGISVTGLGTVQCATLITTNGFVDSNISPGANIAAAKLWHRFAVGVELAGPTAPVTALTKLLHSVKGSSANLAGFQAFIVTKATDVSRTISCDLQRSTAGGAFATVLTTPIAFSSTSTNLTVVTGTISAATLITGDLLQIVVSVAGIAGAQATGLHALASVEETAN